MIRNKKVYETIMNKYVTGECSRKEIAKELGLNDSTIRWYLWFYKIKREPFKEQKYKQIVADYRNGFSVVDLARKYNFSVTTIYNVLKKNGITFGKVGY